MQNFDVNRIYKQLRKRLVTPMRKNFAISRTRSTLSKAFRKPTTYEYDVVLVKNIAGIFNLFLK